MYRVVAQCTQPGEGLPPDKPRYVMGIGYPLDIVLCTALGADMFDSVYPTRTARFGVALADSGILKLRNRQYEEDFRCLLRCGVLSCVCKGPKAGRQAGCCLHVAFSPWGGNLQGNVWSSA